MRRQSNTSQCSRPGKRSCPAQTCDALECGRAGLTSLALPGSFHRLQFYAQ
ncbi:hypothetical protein M758_7G089800 [Ceratodon purpureus]|nr:hypothetical protein M758_7G089800 [Ceratodon purpureus]